MQEPLLMDFNRVQDIGNPLQGKSDAVPYEYLTQWYMRFDDNNIKLPNFRTNSRQEITFK